MKLIDVRIEYLREMQLHELPDHTTGHIQGGMFRVIVTRLNSPGCPENETFESLDKAIEYAKRAFEFVPIHN